jgi:hypothetical protein
VPVGFVPTSSKIQTSKQSKSDKIVLRKEGTIWVDQWTESVEEPPVAIQLFLVLFFETKYNLHGTCALRHLASFCDNDTGGISADQLHKSSNYTIYETYSNMCAVTSLPATESLAIPS